MHRDHRVVAWIPFGRERTVSILIPYLLRDHADNGGVIDEIWLCENTTEGQQSDRDYADVLVSQHPKVISIKKRPGPDHWQEGWPREWRDGPREPVQLNTGRFPVYMTDRQTVYIRFDDDIVWVHPQAVRTLVDRVLDRRADTVAVFPMIWNNAICSWIAQKYGGRFPVEQWGKIGGAARNSQDVSAIDPLGWGDARFAERLHRMVLEHLERGAEDDLLIPAELQLGRRQQFSVSCFAIGGWEYQAMHGPTGTHTSGVLSWDEEEHWLTMHHPGLADRDNRVCGMAQVVHFSFYTQRDHLLSTDLLDRYRALADRVTGSLYYRQLAIQQADGASA